MVRRALESVLYCDHNKIKYNGHDKRRFNKGTPALILPGSTEEAIIADRVEMNLGFRNTTVMVNSHRVEEGRPPVGRNAVMNAFDRMAPQVSLITTIPQGNVNHDGWRVARKNQTKQMLVMLGEISSDESKTEYPDGIPKEFDPDQLPRLTRNQVIFYDETHLEQEGGEHNNKGLSNTLSEGLRRTLLPPLPLQSSTDLCGESNKDVVQVCGAI